MDTQAHAGFAALLNAGYPDCALHGLPVRDRQPFARPGQNPYPA
jgi:hypothetical protein